ncbi:MAG: glycosyltransferase family 2 protein [Bryobacteraceae bacterium]|jgi:glycosyltransferase involved in cell wall biosynthesis
MKVTVIVLTYNEEFNLEPCLGSVRDWAGEMIVVDSGSTDRTREIAARFGATLVTHPFETHTQQWSWALANLPIGTEWVLALDADQRITADLAHEIAGLADGAVADVDGIYIKRRQIFRDRWIRHGGYYPKYLLKLFRRRAVGIDPRDLVDHHFYVAGPTIKLTADLLEVNKKEDDISFWIEKHNRYATLLAREELENKRSARAHLVKPSLLGHPDQQTLMLKRMWSRLPLYVRPFLYFLYRYFIRLGFLDGKQGAIFHFLHAFWFRLLIDIKLDELQQQGVQG